MRPITTLAAALLLTTSATTGLQQSLPDTPNVVLIMTDDAGYADTGSYGAPDIRTPNIDSLARDGVKLTDFYANAILAGRHDNGFDQIDLGGNLHARAFGCATRRREPVSNS